MKTICTLILLISSLLCSSQTKKYVTQNGAGTKDGSSWANAWDAKIFADTLNKQSAGTEIWVAKGIYKPTKDVSGILIPDNISDPYFMGTRKRTFLIPSAVKVIGGFAGTENNITERVKVQLYSQNATVLDGSYPGQSDASSHSWYLITLTNSDENTLLDGFYLYNYSSYAVIVSSNGNSYSSPSLLNCFFGNGWLNRYGNIIMKGDGTLLSNPSIGNCFFTPFPEMSNIPITVQGNCKPLIFNSLFISTEYPRKAIDFNSSKGGYVTNCTFYGNRGRSNPEPTIYGNSTDSIFINNCVFRNDAAANQGDFYHLGKGAGTNLFSVRNTFLQSPRYSGAIAPAFEVGNTSVNPRFKDSLDWDGPDNIYGTADDGLQLLSSSPAKDFGLNDSLAAFAVKDVLGNSRVSGCHVDAGAYEYQIPANNIIILPESATESCTQYPMPDSATTYTDPLTCSVSATVNPVGLSPVSGIIKVCVVKDALVPVVNGVPYVQRHYNIEPLANAATSTARLSIYFTQQEFDNFNAAAGSYPKLPTSPSDVAGIANIRIEQDHGTSLTSVPGTYSGTTVFIDPNDNDIVWNSTSSIWEVSFDVTGFSGFFLRTSQTLPVSLLNFSANEMNSQVKLAWTTSTEINSQYFDILRSSNGNEFTSIGTVNAYGNSNGSSYQFTDITPASNINYYKLKMMDKDGSNKYSNTVSINLKKAQKAVIRISPNPIHTGGTITVSGNLKGKVNISIYNIGGRKIKDIFSNEINTPTLSTTFNTEGLSSGLYIVKLKIEDEIIYSKLLVE